MSPFRTVGGSAGQACLDDETVLAFVEHRLAAGTRTEVEDHIRTCDECRHLIADSAKICFQAESKTTVRGHGEAHASAPANLPLLPSGTQAGRYRIRAPVGSGGMGVVYEAEDPKLGRRVALKIMHFPDESQARRRMLREAQVMAQLSHPHIVAVYDVESFGGRPCVAMEFVAGTTLREWLREGPRPWEQTLGMLVQAGLGLAHAHAAGIVHRDFKPDNVLIGPDGVARVTDFGLAVPMLDMNPATTNDPDAAESRSLDAVTQSGFLAGTPAYMSPEQFVGRSADARSDQFSFCVTLYEALYGQRPFEGATVDELCANVRAGKMRRVPTDALAPGWLEPAISRGLSPDPKDRFDSMELILAELTKDPSAMVHALPEWHRLAAMRPAAPASRRRKLRVVVLAGAGLLALGAAAVVLQHLTVGGAILSDPERIGAATPAPPPPTSAPPAAAPPAAAPPAAAPPAPAPPAPAPPSNAPASAPAAARQEARAQPPPARLLVKTGGKRATIKIDGRVVARNVGDTTVEIAEDRQHVLSVTAPGMVPFTRTVELGAGQRMAVVVDWAHDRRLRTSERAERPWSEKEYAPVNPWTEK
jgi:hypothetical protein